MTSPFRERAVGNVYEAGVRGNLFTGVTIGTVVSTNDPQQMGRLYVHCPELGDPPDMRPEDFEQLPLCTYISPLAGSTPGTFERGPEEGHTTSGPTPYGFWAIPKLGAQVAVMCIDGDPSQRIWFGCMYDQFVTNALPHGRYLYKHNSSEPEGPYSTSESKIQPLYDNQTQAFKTRVDNFEWRTRGADYQAAGIMREYVGRSPTSAQDNYKTSFTAEDGKTIEVTQGYTQNRDGTRGGDREPDNSVYSWTSPGFHGISMDDRIEHCRIRIKTTAGAQIIMDDTNERIYINTAKGNNWIEIDEDGCIDIFSTEKVSFTAKHINLTAEESIRMYAKQGIHMRSDEDIRMHAERDIHVKAERDYKFKALNIDITADGYMRELIREERTIFVYGGPLHLSAIQDINLNSRRQVNITSADNLNLYSRTHIVMRAASNLFLNAFRVHFNSSSAPDATRATDGDRAVPPERTFYVNRYPKHEPWGRCGTKNDDTVEPKYEYEDPEVGREHKERGKLWRR